MVFFYSCFIHSYELGIRHFQMLEYMFPIFQISSNFQDFFHLPKFLILFWNSPDFLSNFSRYIQSVRLIDIPITHLVSMFLCILMNWHLLDIDSKFSNIFQFSRVVASVQIFNLISKLSRFQDFHFNFSSSIQSVSLLVFL